jgi:isopenicillin N synthase-like dioxygenase
MSASVPTDIQLFTLLWQDDLGGLQVLSNTEEWLDASPIQGTLVVNVGDFLQRLSNDRFRSTVHRVYDRAEKSRYSMPCFFGFNADTVCEVVPTCTEEWDPAKYQPISCGRSLAASGGGSVLCWLSKYPEAHNGPRAVPSCGECQVCQGQ